MREIWSDEEEARRLSERFDAPPGVNQKKFAAEFKVPGGASMLTQHKKGHRPINLEAALAYARGFGVGLSEISPRLAQLVIEAYPALVASRGEPVTTKWPFTPTLLAALQNADRTTLIWAENGARAALRLPPLQVEETDRLPA